MKIAIQNNSGIFVIIEDNKQEPEQPAIDWANPDFKTRITAPKILARLYPNLYAWFQVNGMPIEPYGEYVRIYCNEILPEDIELVKQNRLLVEELRDNQVLTLEL
jgi:hypothetical protein